MSSGGVLGIAVLGAIFSSHGSYASGQDYVNGMTVAVYVGAGVVAVGAITAMLVPSRRTVRGQGDLVAPAVLPDLAGGAAQDPGADLVPVEVEGAGRTLCESSPARA